MGKAGPYSIGSSLWPGLSKVLEEMGELQQVMGKLVATGGEAQHWDGSDLKERLREELGDVIAACKWFAEKNSLADADMASHVRGKMLLYEFWHQRAEAEESVRAEERHDD